MKPSAKRWLGLAGVALLVAIATHAVVLYALPHYLMSAAMQRITARLGTNKWSAPPRTTAASRKVVHPSPELSYSACVYDLRTGPVHMLVHPLPNDYWSLSLFDADTDNFRVWDDIDSPHGVDIWLVHGKALRASPPPGVTIVHSPSARGVALIRRHVTDDTTWQEIRTIRRQDLCTAVH